MKCNLNIKAICFNIVLLIIIYTISEAFFYKHYFKTNANISSYWHKSPEYILNLLDDKQKYPDRFHYPDKKYEKEPVLFLGCSYTYGQNLKENETLPGSIHKLTSRPVYNLGVSGRDASTALMLTERFVKDENITQKPKYIIYTYMFHHLHRIHAWKYFDLYRKMGYIPFQKNNFLYNSYTYSYFQNRKLDSYLWYDWEFTKHRKIFFNIIKDIKKITDKAYPDSKFIVLIYNDINYDLTSNLWGSIGYQEYKMNKLFEIQESSDFKKEFEELGITVISTQELIGRKMDKPEDRAVNDPDHPHPSAKAWELIAPKLVERLKL